MKDCPFVDDPSFPFSFSFSPFPTLFPLPLFLHPFSGGSHSGRVLGSAENSSRWFGQSTADNSATISIQSRLH